MRRSWAGICFNDSMANIFFFNNEYIGAYLSTPRDLSFLLPVICLEGGVNHDTIANTLKNQHVSNPMEKKRKKSDYYTRRLARYERRRHRKKKK